MPHKTLALLLMEGQRKVNDELNAVKEVTLGGCTYI